MDRWLLCDYGQVLCLAPPVDEWDALREAAGTGDAEAFRAAYWRHRPAYDRGDLAAGDYWAAVTGSRPSDARLDRLVELDVRIWLHPDQASVTAAGRAAGRGLRLAILSNAPVEVAAGIDALEWLAPFERRYYSCRLGAVKPEPEAYLRVLEDLGTTPDRVRFFDDRPANVEAAAALGMIAELYTDPAQLDAA